MFELDDFRLAFIGAGQMGGALLKGIVDSETLRPDQIVICDKEQKRLQELKEDLNVEVTESIKEACSKCKGIIFAVKPQDLDGVLHEARDSIRTEQLIVSIAAGVSTESILSKLDKETHLVRVMPNSPALVRKGMSVISPSRYASNEATELTIKLFSSVGKTTIISEKLQNQATAISGSGPAYFYLFVEALREAAKKTGLDPEVSAELVLETLIGSGQMLEQTKREPEDLRDMVTSPGGTTEAAIEVFNRKEFLEIVTEAVEAAIKRAEQLG